MNHKAKLLIATAVLSTLGLRNVHADYVTIYPGLNYDGLVTGTGYQGASLRSQSITVANGYAVGTTSDYVDGYFNGSAGQIITTSGAYALIGLANSSSGYTSATASAVNGSGLVVGYSDLYGSSGQSLGQRAVEWLPGMTSPTQLPTLGTSAGNADPYGTYNIGTGTAQALNVSANGTAVGYSTLYNSAGNAVTTVPVEWNSSGGIISLGTISVNGIPLSNYPTISFNTKANSINTSNYSVGSISTSTNAFGARSVIWSPSGVGTELKPLSTNDGTGVTGSTFSYGYAINNSNLTIGDSYYYFGASSPSNLSTDSDNRPVIWNANGNITQLGPISGLSYSSNGYSGRYTGTPYAINSAGTSVGMVTGLTPYDSRAVRWTSTGTATELLSYDYYPAIRGNVSAAYDINDKGLAVGVSRKTVFNTDGTLSGVPNYATLWAASGVPINLNLLIDPSSGWTFTTAYGINNNNWVSGVGSYSYYPDNADGTPGTTLYADPTREFMIEVPNVDTWNNGVSVGGDGVTWDVSNNRNFNDGTGSVVFHKNDIVSFDTAPAGNDPVTISGTVSPSLVYFTNNVNSYTVSAANSSSGISGTASLLKVGSGTVTINTSNSYTGQTNVSNGTLILGVAGALPKGTNLSINGNYSGNSLVASVVANTVGAAYALQVGSLDISSGTLDLKNNALVVHNGTLASVNALVQNGYNNGAWNGANAIISSSAGSISPLMAIGVIVNDNGMGTNTPLYGAGGAINATFAGATPVDGDVLVKYTYYGDANLSGTVDGSDYSRIDAAYLNNLNSSNPQLTGWYNGDFNYDGVVDGSDYTLIDNAFNTQGGQITSEIAASTAEIGAPTAVPEPTTLALVGIGLFGLVGRRSQCR